MAGGDYQLVINDVFVKYAVDELFGGLAMNTPFEFEAISISFNRTTYPARRYADGGVE